jgi:hypothetical protein
MADKHGVGEGCIEWVVERDRNFGGRIGGGSGKDKKPLGMGIGGS